MDVTPSNAMYGVMLKITDSACGEAPGDKDFGPGAIKRREARAMMMGILHQFVAMTMREGIARFVKENGGLTAEAPMRGKDGH